MRRVKGKKNQKKYRRRDRKRLGGQPNLSQLKQGRAG